MPFQFTQTPAPAPDVFVAFVNGLLSFVSPCVLPLLPVYFSALLGAGGNRQRKAVLLRMAGFALGFMAFYLFLGAGAGTMGSLLSSIPRRVLDYVTGGIFILFGLSILEVLPGIHLFSTNANASRFVRDGFLPMLAFGATLALSWAPCNTAFIANVLLMAASANQATVWTGMGLLGVYALGMMVPFLAFMLLSSVLGDTLTFLKKHQAHIRKIGGALMVLFGILKIFHIM